MSKAVAASHFQDVGTDSAQLATSRSMLMEYSSSSVTSCSEARVGGATKADFARARRLAAAEVRRAALNEPIRAIVRILNFLLCDARLNCVRVANQNAIAWGEAQFATARCLMWAETPALWTEVILTGGSAIALAVAWTRSYRPRKRTAKRVESLSESRMMDRDFDLIQGSHI